MKTKFIVKIQMFSDDHPGSSQFLDIISYVVIFNKPSRVFVEHKYELAALTYVGAHLANGLFV
jgi:hypothetical protein